MRILALDLSKSCTGWASWAPGDAVAASGWKQLGSEYTTPGLVFAKLHELMTDVASVSGPIEALFIEDALTPEKLHGHTNIGTTKIQLGLAAHALSWADTMGVRIIREINQSTWRRDFLGKLPKGLRSTDLKDMAMKRARQLGFKPEKHDQAEAIGILDHACIVLDLTPPWQLQLALQTQIGGRR